MPVSDLEDRLIRLAFPVAILAGLVMILLLLCHCASTPLPKPGVGPIVKQLAPDDPSCTRPPEELYGAILGGCNIDKDTGAYCCGYGSAVLLPEGPLVCMHRLCRPDCKEQFSIDLGMCLPAQAIHDLKSDAQESEERSEGIQHL